MLTLIQRLEKDGHECKKVGSVHQLLCPLHDEDTPSCTVYEGQGRDGLGQAKCFGCNACFDSISYLIDQKKYSYKEANEEVFGVKEAIYKKLIGKDKNTGKDNRDKFKRELPPHTIYQEYLYADGAIAFATIRTKHFKALPYMQFNLNGVEGWVSCLPMKNRPLSNLPNIIIQDKDVQVILVEGESKKQALEKLLPELTVTCWTGGTGGRSLVDYEPLYGRNVCLISDGDKGGREAMQWIAKHLHDNKPSNSKAVIKIALIPDHNEIKGYDIADKINEGGTKEEITNWLRGLVTVYEPPTVTSKETPTEENPIANNNYYRIMGYRGGKVIVLQKEARTIHSLSPHAVSQASTLLSIAPSTTWWEMQTDGSPFSVAKRNELVERIYNAAYGEGVYDPSKLVERGASRNSKDETVWHLGGSLLVEGEPKTLDYPDGNIYLGGVSVATGRCATKAERRAVADSVIRYRWKTPSDGQRYLGFIVSSLIGGALDWRPHLWVLAPSGEGKSWIRREVSNKIYGNFCSVYADATAASVARGVGSEAKPLVFEENEPDNSRVKELIELVRISAGGDGERARVSPDGDVSITTPRFSAMIISTKIARLMDADRKRIVVCEFARQGVANWVAVKAGIEEALSGDKGHALRSAIIRDTPSLVSEVRRVSGDLMLTNTNTRNCLIQAALTVGYRWFSQDWETVSVESDTGGKADEPEKLLHEIFGIAVRDETNRDCTLSTLAVKGEADILATYGIKIYKKEVNPNKNGVFVITETPLLHQKLQGVRWLRDVEFRELLGTLKDAEKTINPRHVGAQKRRGIFIPEHTCREAGLELWEAELPSVG